jgi:hypothetical protein
MQNMPMGAKIIEMHQMPNDAAVSAFNTALVACS